MAGFEDRALGEDLSAALAQIEGPNGVRVLRWALRELPLDGGTAMEIATRVVALENAGTPD